MEIPGQTNSSSVISVLDMGIIDEEWERLQKALEWPGPYQLINQLNLSTSPVHSTFNITKLEKISPLLSQPETTTRS